MLFEIKNRWNGAVLFLLETKSMKLCMETAVKSETNLRDANLGGANLRGANLGGANLRDANLGGANLGDANLGGANLRGANLGGANLRDANLGGANLYCADLYCADLRGANLYGVNLRGANLRGANLGGAKGINPYRCTPLLFLLDQPGKIRAYKVVDAKGEGPFKGGITYEIGKTYKVGNADCDINHQCGAGINLATLDWCMREWTKGYRILIAEFTAKDIATIPTSTDGKFRVHRCKIVGEKNLSEIGLTPAPAAGPCDQQADQG